MRTLLTYLYTMWCAHTRTHTDPHTHAYGVYYTSPNYPTHTRTH